jgi:hypothetical protein
MRPTVHGENFRRRVFRFTPTATTSPRNLCQKRRLISGGSVRLLTVRSRRLALDAKIVCLYRRNAVRHAVTAATAPKRVQKLILGKAAVQGTFRRGGRHVPFRLNPIKSETANKAENPEERVCGGNAERASRVTQNQENWNFYAASKSFLPVEKAFSAGCEIDD